FCRARTGRYALYHPPFDRFAGAARHHGRLPRAGERLPDVYERGSARGDQKPGRSGDWIPPNSAAYACAGYAGSISILMRRANTKDTFKKTREENGWLSK